MNTSLVETTSQQQGKPFFQNPFQIRSTISVLYTEGWVCDVALIEYTLGPGKPKGGWDFGREGTRGQWGTKGVSLRATWD
jgi:hypothetical protein